MTPRTVRGSSAVVALALWVGASAPARAEVELSDATIEVALTYGEAPVHFVGEHEPLTTTSLRFSDRNGAFGKLIMTLLFRPSDEPHDGRHVSAVTRTYDGLGISVTEYTVRVESPEEYARVEADRIRRLNEFDAYSGYTTELQIYAPREGTSEASGASFELMARGGSRRFSFELGFRWSYLKGPVCGSEAVPTTCSTGFTGIPAKLTVRLGRWGWVDTSIGWNLRKELDEGARQNRTPITAGLTLNPIDRLFVRAAMQTTKQDVTRPGFVLELGGRL